jgi:hypothetical protein
VRELCGTADGDLLLRELAGRLIPYVPAPETHAACGLRTGRRQFRKDCLQVCDQQLVHIRVLIGRQLQSAEP